MRQVDTAGNTSTANSVTWTVDTAAPVAPTATRTAPVSSPTNSTNATITYSGIESGATAQCSTDGTTYTTCAASPISLTGLSAGVKTYYVRQIDSAGNLGPANSVTWTIDMTPPVAPTVTRTAPASTPTNSTSATITYSGIESGATAQCSTDGTTYTTCAASPINLSGVSDGVKTYYVRQVDLAGNTSTATSVTWTVDTALPVAPTVTRTLPASSPTPSTSASIAYTGVESGATAQCSTNGTTYTACAASPVSLSGLAEGVQTYYVRQVDSAGNIGPANSVTWTIDTSAPTGPTVTRTAPASSPSQSTSATIAYSGIESGATAQCSTDNATWATCAASPISLTGLSDGVKNYYVRQVDTAGNTSAVNSVTWTVDTTPPVAPTVTRTTPVSTPTNSASATITYTGIESGATAQCSTDSGTTWATCAASPISLAGLSAGVKTYSVRQVDTAGNVGSADTVTWTIDLTAPVAPTVTRTAPVSTPTNSASATITYTGIESGATAQCSTDGTTYTTCAASPISLTGLTDGVNTYYVRQIDSAGNTGPANSISWTVDTVAPAALTVTRTAPTSTPTNSTSATITYSAVESGATAQCSTDGTTYTTCAASPVSLPSLTDGVKTYYVRQVDSAGNNGPANSVTWTVDTAPPAALTVTRTAPVSSPTNSTSATITYSAVELGATAQCSTDGGTTWTTCAASPISLTGLSEGVKTYAIRQVDSAGNAGSANTVTWTVDTMPPVAPTVTRTVPTTSPTNTTAATITYSGIESGATAQCSTDGTAYTTCTASPISLTGLTDGMKTYYVRQVDSAGNTGPANSVTWTVDTVAPAAPSVSSNRSGEVSQTTATITYTVAEPGGTVECSTDDTTYTTCAASPLALNGLSDGLQTYYVRQVDAAGNVGTAESVSWTVDTGAPSAPTVISNRTGSVSESTATITYTPSEPGGTLECSLDGEPFAACTSSPINITGLTDGPHTYSVRQRDAAGNSDSAGTVAWIVDLTAPNAPAIAAPTGSPYYSPTATPTFSGNAEPGSTLEIYDGATLVATTTADGSGDWSVAASTLSDGPHSITATATDPAGNTGAASAATNVTVDTAIPVVAISAPADGSFISTTAPSVDFSVSDANPGTSQCKVDGGSFVSCNSGYTVATLDSGSHTITVEHTDLAGSVGSSSTTFTVDDSTPVVSISSPTASQHVPTSVVEIDFSVTDANPSATSSCSVDGETATSCTSPFTTASLIDGGHTVNVSHTDTAGNTGTAVVTFTVDTQAPGPPSITDAPDNPIASDEVEFSFTGTEAGGTFECSLNGAPFTTCISPVHYLGLTDGDHDFQVRQVDEAGNAGAVTPYTFTVDTLPPATPTLNGPSAHTNNPESTVTFSGSPDTVELRCSFNGGPFAACPTSPLSLGTLPDGDYTFTVQAYDEAGNSSTSTISWEVDTVAPGAPTITAGPVGSVPSPDAQFSFTGAEADGIYRCGMNAQPSVTCTSPFDITGLADGTYTFRVRQVDASGNVGPATTRTWTVDTTPPPTPTVTGPSSPSGQTSATIDFSTTESGVTFECSVDSGAYAACIDPLSLTGLTDGAHTVEVRAYDSAGNGSAIGSFTWTVDHTLYTADISGAPSGVVNMTTASMALTASLPDSTFECSLDGAEFTPCNSLVSLSALTEGSHTFKLHASKASQNAPEVTRTWTVDLTNPSATITAPLASSTTAPDTSIAFTTNDLHAPITTTCKLDSAAAAPCTSPQSYTNLTEGNHTVVVTATDAAGNSGSAAVTWHVDATAPNAPQITVPTANGATTDTTPTVSGTAEANSTVKLYDGATLIATITTAGDGSWSWTPSSPLPEAAYNFHATATDVYDNVSASSATRTVTIDTTAPNAPSVTAPAAGLTSDSTPLVTGAAEPGSTVTVYVDGNPVTGTVTVAGDGSWQKPITPVLADGPHTITVRATDDVGNVSDPSSDLAISVDTVAPSVSITSPEAAAKVNSESPSVTFTTESGATTRCKIDGGAYGNCTSPFSTSGLPEGSHTVSVEATDPAGNVATAVVTFTVDLTDPTAQLTGGPNEGGDSGDDTPTFTFTSNEPGTFECSIDGAPLTACSSPFTLPALDDGEHTFTVHSVDQAGNASPDEIRTWTVDTTAPGDPTIDAPAPNPTTDNTPTITGDAEVDSTLTVYINGNASGTTTVDSLGHWSFTVSTALSDNVYALTAKAADTAGNVSLVSNTVNLSIDANDPTATITAKPGALSNDNTPTFSFTSDEPGTFKCKIDSGAWTACTSPFTSPALGDGPHNFFVRAIDENGNVSGAEEWDWTIDSTAPNVTVTPTMPAAGLSPTFTFNSTESGTTYKCRIDSTGVFATCSSPFNAPTLAVGNHSLEVQYTDAAGNTGTKPVNFTVSAPPVAAPPATNPPVAAPPTAQTCTGSGDEPGVPANMTVISAVAKKNTVKFTTSSDKYILIRVSIYNGRKLVGTSVRANNPGKRLVAIKTRKALPGNKKFTVRLSAITMTGGKSVVTTYLATDKKGKTTVVGADGKVGAPPVSTVECGAEKGSKKIKVAVATKVSVKISDKKFAATAKASDWAVATFRVVQGGKTIARKVVLVKPGKKTRVSLKALAGHNLVKGKAMIQVATCTVDGQWQLFKKPFNVK